MESVAAAQIIRGGFKAEREFGFALEGRFPGLDLSGVDTEGVAMVVEIGDPKRLNLHQLSRVLVGAAKGGVKTAVINFREKGLTTAIPLFNLFAMVDESARLKELRKLERAIRTGV
ncbi:holliday junction resolvase [Streptomyces phage Success]|uniref:Holliday junction resolvase n=1 Tax=Streptomyces phage Success TaxID=2999013 RepID=A0A9E8S1W4_9CAUD|nr:holliday junction resolvase [Streptomyces phage Success]WAB08821.1 holliday junction resolvase [Streptomyces phage Success]